MAKLKLHSYDVRRALLESDVATDLLTTHEVAKLLGVGTTSIKRWADSGHLRCVKTPGGHRRFPRDAVAEFMARNHHRTMARGSAPAPPISDALFDSLIDGRSTAFIVELLESRRRERDSWFSVADSVAQVIDEIGLAWQRNELSVIQEHIASQRLARALSLGAESIETSGTRACLIMNAEGDEHTLGLHLLELCLREMNWNATWAGRKTPVHFACDFIRSRTEISMLAVSASQFSSDAPALADQADRLGRACQDRGIPMLLGGHGLWPTKPSYGYRLHSFRELQAWFASRES